MTDNTEEKFDLLVPPGVPRKIIYEINEKFDVEIVHRPQRMYFANMEGDARELLAFRGDLETVQKVEEYLFSRLEDFIADTGAEEES
ncbi:hypothetical protein AZH53_04470 [Methanomicrobiaceae archaeon CYW5]|uniref:hypothetical protein n=1 Tax=Methanovulcanius yangii TaxID=1789227 RepID=UPI0029CA7737|nr:hypothetical protein [Methanovulcanius yangii]MBT8507672.1 hypothetical protein [Methanovulcanius yangii]